MFESFEDISIQRDTPKVAALPMHLALEPLGKNQATKQEAKSKMGKTSRIKKKRLNKRNLTEMEREFIKNFDYKEYIAQELTKRGERD